MAVVWCDPRGSVSYGKEFEKGAWDGSAYDDLMAFLDAAIGLGFIERETASASPAAATAAS